MSEIHQHQIRIYEFPDCEEEDDAKLLKQLKSKIPFAVCGSNYIADVNGERRRVRKFPWGTVESKWFLICLRDSHKPLTFLILS